jgi:hypothetical protein
VSRGIERSGFKDARTIATERRSDGRVRALSAGVDRLKASPFGGGTLLEEIDLTTTPEPYEHGLQTDELDRIRATGARVGGERLVGVPPRGAWLVAGQDGTFDLVWSQHPTNPNKFILLSVSSGTHTVSVAVI